MKWSPGYTLESWEQVAIEEAYTFHKNNKTATANTLKISIRTLDAKLAKYAGEAESRKLAQAQARVKDQEELRRAMAVPSQFQIPSSIRNV